MKVKKDKLLKFVEDKIVEDMEKIKNKMEKIWYTTIVFIALFFFGVGMAITGDPIGLILAIFSAVFIYVLAHLFEKVESKKKYYEELLGDGKDEIFRKN